MHAVVRAVSVEARAKAVRVLHADNVLARRYFHPGCHRMEPYRTRFPEAGARLPHTEALTRSVLVLPTGTAVGPREIDTIGAILRLAVAQAPELGARLRVQAGPA